MSPNILSGILYLLCGAATVYLFQDRRKGLSSVTSDRMPELDDEVFDTLRNLLKTAYERILYLGVSFLLLAFVTLKGSEPGERIFFVSLLVILFLYNIPPRHKIMKLLSRYGVDYKDLKKRGIRL